MYFINYNWTIIYCEPELFMPAGPDRKTSIAFYTIDEAQKYVAENKPK